MSDAPSSGWRLFFVWLGLAALAGLSFGLSFLHLGDWSAIIPIAIAFVMAGLISAYFMHLAQQAPPSRWAYLFGLALVCLLITMVSIDVTTRHETGVRQPGLGSDGHS